MKYSIRGATLDDIDSIHALIKSDPEHLIPRDIGEIRDLIGSFFVALDDQNDLLGCVCLEIYSQKLAELRSLIVKPSGRGHGIATALIERAILYGSEKKVTEILSITGVPKLFKKSGFSYTLPNEKQALFYSFRHKKDDAVA